MDKEDWLKVVSFVFPIVGVILAIYYRDWEYLQCAGASVFWGYIISKSVLQCAG